MIITSNLPKLVSTALAHSRVLDVGGWWRPFNCATHVIDVMPHETRRSFDALDPENAERFDASTWAMHDVCREPWPYSDKFFDFAVCSHLLEDVRDPIAVCDEMIRVSRAGYIECPSRDREIFTKERFFTAKAAFGHIPEIGFRHHRWFVEIDGAHISFTVKDQHLLASRGNFLTRSDTGRKLTEQESGVALWWEEHFTYDEIIDHGRNLAHYREDALRRLKAHS